MPNMAIETKSSAVFDIYEYISFDRLYLKSCDWFDRAHITHNTYNTHNTHNTHNIQNTHNTE